MYELGEEHFDWLTWRNGNSSNLFITCNTPQIIAKKEILRKFAIGYCEGHKLNCRPKNNCMAVMFCKDNILFWFHLTNYEFKEVFYAT